MPTYQYACEACGHQFEQFQSIKDRPLRKCPACSRLRLNRLIGTGGGIIFKGSGFYQTDYRSENYKNAAKSAGTSTGSKDSAKKDAKAPAESSSPKQKD